MTNFQFFQNCQPNLKAYISANNAPTRLGIAPFDWKFNFSWGLWFLEFVN